MSAQPKPSIRLVRRNQFSVVPDSILTDPRLSLTARAILAYLVGRPDGWTVFVAHIQRTLHVTEPVWRRARREMQAAGYFRQERLRGEGGKWVWHNLIYDEPNLPDGTGDPPTILSKTTDGEAMDGDTIHGEPGDKTRELKQENLNKRTCSSAGSAGASAPRARGSAAAAEGIGKKRRRTSAGMITWDHGDQEEAARISATASAGEVEQAVKAVESSGKEPVPGRVAREIDRARQADRNAAASMQIRTTVARLEIDQATATAGAALLPPSLRARAERS